MNTPTHQTMQLGDLTSKELSIISLAIASQIQDAQERIEFTSKYVKDRQMLKEITAKDSASLPVLKEFHVQLLNAKQVVREREIITEN